MVVFRPFKGEILLGKISSASQHGIKSTLQPYSQCLVSDNITVRLDFFDDIFVPPHLLFEGSYL
jgi:DNA-directed RNA polymerase III subunit RPC8